MKTPVFTIEYSTSFVNEEIGYSAWLQIEGPAGTKSRHCGWCRSSHGAALDAQKAAAEMRDLLIGLTGETVLVKRGPIEQVAADLSLPFNV